MWNNGSKNKTALDMDTHYGKQNVFTHYISVYVLRVTPRGNMVRFIIIYIILLYLISWFMFYMSATEDVFTLELITYFKLEKSLCVCVI